jgi:prepilin-type N-terminal cleavage/methylation domain-containing protein
MHKKQQFFAKAFTLLELSIVLVVISVLTVGVFMGAGLIDASKLSVARSLTERSVVPQINGLVAWYETSSLGSFDKDKASNGSVINTWYDINPSSIPQKKNTLTAKTGEVTYVKKGVNNIPSLRFCEDGSPSSISDLNLTDFASGSSMQNTVFVVFKHLYRESTISNTYWIIDSISGSHYALGYQDYGSSDAVRFSFGVTVSTANSSALFDVGKSYILSWYGDQSYSKAYLNDAINVVGGGYVNPGSVAMKGLNVGATNDEQNSNYFTGLLSEIIIYNRILKEEERKEVFRYLSKKYNIKVVGI